MAALYHFEQGRVIIQLSCLRMEYSRVLQMEFNLTCLMFRERIAEADIAAAVIPIDRGWLVTADIKRPDGRVHQVVTVDRATNEVIDFGLIMAEIMDLLTPIDLVPGIMSRLTELDQAERQKYENPCDVVERLLAELE